MKIKNIEGLLSEHPFFKDFTSEDLKLVAGCAKNVVFKPNVMIAREGERADVFYLIRRGKVAIETDVPGQGPFILQTASEGELFGWSWIFPPYKWTFDARTFEEVHALSINGACLRKKCDTDNRLGYFLMKKFAGIVSQRLRVTRLRLIDIYATAPRRDVSP